LRVLIEPPLRGFDDVFVFPAFDAALVGRCALILEPACAARLRQVNRHFLAIFISGEVVRQLSPAGHSKVAHYAILPELAASRLSYGIAKRVTIRVWDKSGEGQGVAGQQGICRNPKVGEK
jgi:hypothetical protein